MRTDQVEIAILKFFKFNKNIIVNTITASYNLLRFETDVLILTKSGYAHGIEIKVSKSDLKNDLHKRHWIKYDEDPDKAIKQYFGKFKYFSYCVPSSLVADTIAQVPDFCGIYEVIEIPKYGRDLIKVVRNPKKITNYKFTMDEMLKVAHLGCMRIFNLKIRLTKDR